MNISTNKIQAALLACAVVVFASSSVVSKLSAVDTADNQGGTTHTLATGTQEVELIPHPKDGTDTRKTTTTPKSGTPSAKTASAPNSSAQPTYEIIPRPFDAYSDRITYATGDLFYLIVPFDVIGSAGNEFSETSGTGAPFSCRIVSSPSSTESLICSISRKPDGSRLVSLQYDRTTTAGTYIVEIFRGVDHTVKRGTVEFQVSGTGA